MPKLPERKRIRRAPAEARALILDAARRVLNRLGPDRAGLKHVAKEAGVSHSLVSHYFGTIEALVEEATGLHITELRAQLLERIAAAPGRALELLISSLFEHLGDPSYGRLFAWALLSGRMDASDFFFRRDQGPRKLADFITAHGGAGTALVDRADLELKIALILSVAFGYAMGGKLIWSALGREQSPELDRVVADRLTELVAK